MQLPKLGCPEICNNKSGKKIVYLVLYVLCMMVKSYIPWKIKTKISFKENYKFCCQLVSVYGWGMGTYNRKHVCSRKFTQSYISLVTVFCDDLRSVIGFWNSSRPHTHCSKSKQQKTLCGSLWIQNLHNLLFI